MSRATDGNRAILRGKRSCSSPPQLLARKSVAAVDPSAVSISRNECARPGNDPHPKSLACRVSEMDCVIVAPDRQGLAESRRHAGEC